jgi:hypothetical protein
MGGHTGKVVSGNANGFVVAIISPQCLEDQCRGVEVVSNGRVIWSVVAFSNGSLNAVESFLDSFAPIG